MSSALLWQHRCRILFATFLSPKDFAAPSGATASEAPQSRRDFTTVAVVLQPTEQSQPTARVAERRINVS